MINRFSDYLIFVDESGSPNMGNIDPNYPVFVLAFLVVKKEDYVTQLTPEIQKFKFKYFGHDQIIFHERDIRKDLGDFKFLKKPEMKQAFLDELTNHIHNLPFHLVCVVIDKLSHKIKYINPTNPYHLGLAFGLERIRTFLIQEGEWAQSDSSQMNLDPTLHVVVEKRGKAEDDELELEFRRICDGDNFNNIKLNIEIIFADKKSNSVGLQIADLVARPIGMAILKPDQSNRAVDVLKHKLLKKVGRIDGWGLKKFP